MSTSTHDNWKRIKKFAREATIIVVDIDSIEHTKKTISIDRLIISDVKQFLKSMNKNEIKVSEEKWINKCLHWKKLFPK